jgi:hypothetical protein
MLCFLPYRGVFQDWSNLFAHRDDCSYTTISATLFLHLFRSSVFHATAFTSSPHAIRSWSVYLVGLRPPQSLFPSVPPAITNFSRLSLSLLIMCPKCCGIRRIHTMLSRLGLLISARMEAFVRLAVHGIRSILLQIHNSRLSILFRSVFPKVKFSLHMRLFL